MHSQCATDCFALHVPASDFNYDLCCSFYLSILITHPYIYLFIIFISKNLTTYLILINKFVIAETIVLI